MYKVPREVGAGDHQLLSGPDPYPSMVGRKVDSQRMDLFYW